MSATLVAPIDPESYQSQIMTTLTQPEIPYKTAELELASFLKSRGHKLLSAKMSGRFVTFEFTSTAAEDVDGYFGGVETSARDLFAAHRNLRALIQQVKEHASQIKIGSDHNSNDHFNSPRR